MRPRARLLVAASGLAAALLLPLGAAAGPEVPYLSGHVNDTAGMIPPQVRDRIEQQLAALQKATGAQVAVLTIKSLDGEPLEDYSMKVAQTWTLGRKGVDDGVLLLIARDDRKMRIEVGYGLEPKLTDIACKRILDDTVRPAFRNGDFGGGVESGVNAIAATIEGKPMPPSAAPSGGRPASSMPLGARLLASLMFVVVVGTFSVVALIGKGCMSWFLYAFLMPFYAMFPIGIWGSAGAALFFAWIVGFPIGKLLLAKTDVGKGFLASHPGLVSFAASSGHSGSGGGFSSGGFSGGGGSFGGGGASSGW